jgi:hypothetical protein
MRVTRLPLSQVTWNQVQGLTSVGSQLWSTPPGSLRLRRSAESVSPLGVCPHQREHERQRQRSRRPRPCPRRHHA